MGAKSDKLTDKQEKYVQQLLITDNSQRDAYKIAYPKSLKWKDSSVDESASRLFHNVKVQARYNELHDKIRQKAEDEGLLSATDVLRKINELIVRNEEEDDRTALEALKTYGKHLKLWTDKVELSVKELPEIIIKRGK